MAIDFTTIFNDHYEEYVQSDPLYNLPTSLKDETYEKKILFILEMIRAYMSEIQMKEEIHLFHTTMDKFFTALCFGTYDLTTSAIGNVQSPWVSIPNGCGFAFVDYLGTVNNVMIENAPFASMNDLVAEINEQSDGIHQAFNYNYTGQFGFRRYDGRDFTLRDIPNTPSFLNLVGITPGVYRNIYGNAARQGTLLGLSAFSKFNRPTAVPTPTIPVFQGGIASDDDVAAYLTRAGGLPQANIDLLDALVGDLKNAGIWTKLDALWVFASQYAIPALYNLKNGNFTAINNGMTFIRNKGYFNADALSFLDMSFNPYEDGDQVSDGSASLGVVLIPHDLDGNYGQHGGYYRPDPYGGAEYRFHASNGAYGFTYAAVGSSGEQVIGSETRDGVPSLITGVRDGQFQYVYFNDELLGTNEDNNATGLVNASLYMGGLNHITGTDGPTLSDSDTAYAVGAAFVGSVLTEQEVGDVYAALNTYFTAQGHPLDYTP